MRVPDRLEVAKRLDQVGAEHLRQQFALGLPIAVLARQRAVIGEAEIRRFLHILAKLLYAVGGLQPEGHPGVDAAVAEMAEQRIGIAEALVQLVELAQVIAEPLRRHRRILPARPGLFFARDAHRADPGFAHRPHRRLVLRLLEQTHIERAGADPLQFGVGLLGGGIGLFLVLAAEFDEQVSAALRQQANAGVCLSLAAHVVDDVVAGSLRSRAA